MRVKIFRGLVCLSRHWVFPTFKAYEKLHRSKLKKHGQQGSGIHTVTYSLEYPCLVGIFGYGLPEQAEKSKARRAVVRARLEECDFGR